MKTVVARVREAGIVFPENSSLEKVETGEGVAILLGITHGDTIEDSRYLAEKIAHLRIFSDADGKMNKSVIDIKGQCLVISQFTLYADCRKGRRPDFSQACAAEEAKRLYEDFIESLKQYGTAVKTGIFGAHMEVRIFNSGPVTLIIDSRERSFNR